jgi:alkylated DNA nucleotide flippase Atl1
MKIFAEKCYDILKKVPSGKVTTYKEIAHALNSKAYRAVGSAMNKNHIHQKFRVTELLTATAELEVLQKVPRKKLKC